VLSDLLGDEFVTADPRDMLQTALASLQDCGCRTLLVVEDGRLVGLVTADNLAEVLMIQQASHEARRSRRRPDWGHDRDGNGHPRKHAGVPSSDRSATASGEASRK
jgi:CBS-domain-containing membrane protein